MRVSFYNIGCKVNYAEVTQLGDQFRRYGHEVVDYGSEADAVIINTCSVTNNAEADCRKIIRRTKRNTPDAFIGVVGCYAQLKPNEIAAIEGVDGVFGIKEKFEIHEIIDDFVKGKQPEVHVSGLESLPFDYACSCDVDSRTRVVMKIQDGCDYHCTYCTIPLARGGSRSLPFEDIPGKIAQIEEQDYDEVILSGINLGEYKAPTGENFTDVIRLIDNSDTSMRFRISSIEPNLISDEIISIVSDSDKICRHFHIPLQSGSPEILKLMKRRYKAEDFGTRILKIREFIPNCGIGVDVITGFPGETDQHFRETFELLASLPITYLHVFSYSERPNTEAINLPGKVPGNIKKERTALLRTLSDVKQQSFYNSQLGSVFKVIPENEDKTGEFYRGWTGNYIKVKYPKDGTDGVAPVNIRLKEVMEDYVLAEVIR